MPFYRNRKFRGRRYNRRRRNNKVSVYSRKGARSQSRQIWKNQSQITGLQRKIKQTYTTNYYSHEGHRSNFSYPGYVEALIKPSTWKPIFNSDPLASDSATHARMNSIDIKGLIQVEEGTGVVQCDVYLLQAQPNVAAILRQNLGQDWEDLELKTTLGDGKWNNKYYYNTGNSAEEGRRGTMLNPKAFKIRGHRSFQIGNVAETGVADPTQVTNIGDANKRFHFKIRHPIKLENPLGENLTGQDLSWRSIIDSQIQAHKQLFLFCSCNAVLGTELHCDWNMVVSMNEPN